MRRPTQQLRGEPQQICGFPQDLNIYRLILALPHPSAQIFFFFAQGIRI